MCGAGPVQRPRLENPVTSLWGASTFRPAATTHGGARMCHMTAMLMTEQQQEHDLQHTAKSTKQAASTPNRPRCAHRSLWGNNTQHPTHLTLLVMPSNTPPAAMPVLLLKCEQQLLQAAALLQQPRGPGAVVVSTSTHGKPSPGYDTHMLQTLCSTHDCKYTTPFVHRYTQRGAPSTPQHEQQRDNTAADAFHREHRKSAPQGSDHFSTP